MVYINILVCHLTRLSCKSDRGAGAGGGGGMNGNFQRHLIPYVQPKPENPEAYNM